MSEYAQDLTLYVKVLPVNMSGMLPLASALQMQITTVSRARAPYPPGNVKLNSLAYSAWPASIVGDATLTWSKRSRPDEGIKAKLVRQDDVTAFTQEGTVTVRVYVDGILKRTFPGLTGTSQVYTLAQRTADNADLTKPVHFTITPVSDIYTGTVRTTPPFTMS